MLPTAPPPLAWSKTINRGVKQHSESQANLCQPSQRGRGSQIIPGDLLALTAPAFCCHHFLGNGKSTLCGHGCWDSLYGCHGSWGVAASRLTHCWPSLWAPGAGGVLGNGSGLKLCKSPSLDSQGQFSASLHKPANGGRGHIKTFSPLTVLADLSRPLLLRSTSADPYEPTDRTLLLSTPQELPGRSYLKLMMTSGQMETKVSRFQAVL